MYMLNERIDNAHVKKFPGYERINIAHVEFKSLDFKNIKSFLLDYLEHGKTFK